MKQRFYVVIDCKKTIEPKDVLFALREARPNWGEMSASLAAQQMRAADAGCSLCGHGIGYHNDPSVGHQYQEPVAQPRR
jgi:hypothetical protein